MKKRDKTKFSIKMQKKLVVLFVLVLLAFACLSVRLVLIAKENGTQYQKQILSQQRYDSTTIPYRRGDIVDSRGTILATSEKVYNLVIDAKVMNTELGGKKPYLEPTLTALGQYFDLNMQEIRAYVTTNTSSSWYVPLRRLTYDQISGFIEARIVREDDSPEVKTNKGNIQGVWFEEEYKREYPYASLAADMIGFTTTDGQGKYGLEEFYNATLSGVNGREYGYLNDDLNLERTVQAPLDGNTLHVTIDANLQMIVEKYLQKFNDEHKDEFVQGANGAQNIGCIMMRVNTGEILAMASYPTYDLNDTRNPSSLIGSMEVEQITNANGYFEIHKTGNYISEARLAEMDEDQIYLNLNNLWKNFCITGTYEPGSTAKPFTVAAALESGVISPATTFECTGKMDIGGYEIRCHNKYDGTLTLEEAVAKSCNVSMMKIAQVLGREAFTEYQQMFNFGLKTNIDLAGEARTASLIYTADQMGPTDLATNSFGQNFNATMIQMITGFCALINGGYYYEPHVVDKITNSSGATVANIEPRVLKQVISESTSELIRQYCVAVVDYGTGHTARPAGYMIGGKTGTAETIDENTHKRSETEHVVSFIGFAPADDPQVAIYVVVDRPNVSHQGDAKYATGIVRNILMEALPYLNIFMTEELSEAEIAELNALHLEITNQYTQRPEDDALEGADAGEGQGGDEMQFLNPDGTRPAWMDFPIDPLTGYRVDPATGDKYDARAGFLVEGGSTPVIDPNMPVNGNLINPPQE
ncbi:MAG: penicillin-binding protein 2 [Eubacterium sp.]|nr:penicillin-binding protein 2 [Eubacterium sp.]